MLNHEYVPFQYVVVYIAVLQVSPICPRLDNSATYRI